MNPAGWYDNPDGSPNLRWWDGTQWTHHVHEKPPAGAFAPGIHGAPGIKHGKKSISWKIVVPAAVVALLFIGGIAGVSEESEEPTSSAVTGTGGGNGDNNENSAPTETDQASAGDSGNDPLGTKDNPAAVGTSVENKSARYTITSVRTDSAYGSDFLQDTANGMYTIVSMTVENVKDSPIDFSAWDLTLLVDGVEYEVSDAVYSSVGENGLVLADGIGPRMSISGEMVFDVPPELAGQGVIEAQAVFSFDEAVYLSLQ